MPRPMLSNPRMNRKPNDTGMFIYHIALPSEWERFKEKPSYQPAGLANSGFIHCCFANQIDGVLKRYFRGKEKVLILKIDTKKLRSKLVEEPSTNEEVYPHIYGRLNQNAVVAIEERYL